MEREGTEKKGNGGGRSCFRPVMASVFRAVVGALLPTEEQVQISSVAFLGLHSERTGTGVQMFGSSVYRIFKDHLGKDSFCILTFDESSGFGGLICEVTICQRKKVYLQHLALSYECNLISKDIILCCLGTAALDGNLIIFGFCLRLSTDIYLAFYPIVILSVLLFTLT